MCKGPRRAGPWTPRHIGGLLLGSSAARARGRGVSPPTSRAVRSASVLSSSAAGGTRSAARGRDLSRRRGHGYAARELNRLAAPRASGWRSGARGGGRGGATCRVPDASGIRYAQKGVGVSGSCCGIVMERFDEHNGTSPRSRQHSDRVSDSAEDPISDEDAQPTRLSLACATSENREKDNRMVAHDESAIWDEILEEADELAHVRKDHHSVSLLSAGTSKRSKCENKLKFSIRDFNSIVSGVKSENSYDAEQEVSSGIRPAKAIETMIDEQLEDIDEETDDLPSDFAHPTKNAYISVAELLEDLQDRSASSVRTSFSIHQQIEAKEGKPKVLTSGKKILPLLGQRNLDNEEPSEHAIGETSSEDEVEDAVQNNLTMVNKDVKGNRKTMSDLFQEAFNATYTQGTVPPMRSTGSGYYGRMQQIMQMEKDRHTEFSRQYNKAQDNLGDSKGVTVQILSRSLEGKLAVCLCLLKEKSNFPLTSKVSTDCDMDDSSSKRTIIFSPKICDSVDLVEGNIIHIYPPWKEVKVREEKVMLCTYFSHHAA